jgi:hypothetical protein
MIRPPWLLLVVGGLALLGAGCRATEKKPPSGTPWLAGKWGTPNDQTADFSLIELPCGHKCVARFEVGTVVMVHCDKGHYFRGTNTGWAPMKPP